MGFCVYGIELGLADCNYSLWSKFSEGPDSIKFYWNTAMPIGLCIIYGCFHATTAELNSCLSLPESIWPPKPKIVTIWPFTEAVCQFLIRSIPNPMQSMERKNSLKCVT